MHDCGLVGRVAFFFAHFHCVDLFTIKILVEIIIFNTVLLEGYFYGKGDSLCLLRPGSFVTLSY